MAELRDRLAKGTDQYYIGFLGIGGVQISDSEKAAVNELDSALSAKA